MIHPNHTLAKRPSMVTWALTPQPPHDCPCGCSRVVTPDMYRPRKKYFSDTCKQKVKVERKQRRKEQEGQYS